MIESGFLLRRARALAADAEQRPWTRESVVGWIALATRTALATGDQEAADALSWILRGVRCREEI
jgi:hypothetical protein